LASLVIYSLNCCAGHSHSVGAFFLCKSFQVYKTQSLIFLHSHYHVFSGKIISVQGAEYVSLGFTTNSPPLNWSGQRAHLLRLLIVSGVYHINPSLNSLRGFKMSVNGIQLTFQPFLPMKQCTFLIALEILVSKVSKTPSHSCAFPASIRICWDAASAKSSGASGSRSIPNWTGSVSPGHIITSLNSLGHMPVTAISISGYELMSITILK